MRNGTAGGLKLANFFPLAILNFFHWLFFYYLQFATLKFHNSILVELISPEARDVVVKLHNEIRSIIAKGNQKNKPINTYLPPAANMYSLVR